MKNTIKLIAACAVLAGTSGTFAAGSHAGGHGTQAIGKPGVAAKVTRTITIDMTDAMRFTPSAVKVRRGETIRFVVTNSGKLKHEFNLGTEADLKAHYAQMLKFPEMEHDEPNLVSLAPGKTGEVIWQFTKAGTVHFACLHPGHYEAGMKGTVAVGNKP
nr:cupredoxin family protein [uncultured Rhodoferax sp.]